MARDETQRVETERARLEATARELKSAQAELEHQARRYGDAVERGGGRSVDTQLEIIRKTMKLNAGHLKRVDKQRAQLEKRLAELGGGPED